MNGPGKPQKLIVVTSQSLLRTNSYGLDNLCVTCGDYHPTDIFSNRKREDGLFRFTSQCKPHYNERKRQLSKFRAPLPETPYNDRQALAQSLRDWATRIESGEDL